MDGLTGKTVAFIGGGAMARALASGLLSAGVPKKNVLLSEPNNACRKQLEQDLGVETSAQNARVVQNADIVVLAVKPAIVGVALKELANQNELDLSQPLWVSIAAGVSIASIENHLPKDARVVRAMPNTPAQVHAGATTWVANSTISEDDRAATNSLFAAVGTSWEAPQEGMLDAATGLAGSGPAYVFVIIEALSDAGVRAGLPREAATQLAAQTVYGAGKLVLESGKPPGVLKDQVSSPGGTTIAGLERLDAGGLRAALHDAVDAATRRSRELG
jgi:pyrroline-5-carboxylate reductase